MVEEKSERKAAKKSKRDRVNTSNKLYTMCVYLLDGPIAGKYCGQTISRTIQIRGDQTLEDLHHAIFKAFEREDEHIYEFNLGEGPDDRSAIYSIQSDNPELSFNQEEAGDVTTTTIDSLGLAVGRAFGYLFDFGDNWLHQINVIAVEEILEKGRYPKTVAREGKSPPQYPDEDEPNYKSKFIQRDLRSYLA